MKLNIKKENIHKSLAFLKNPNSNFTKRSSANSGDDHAETNFPIRQKKSIFKHQNNRNEINHEKNAKRTLKSIGVSLASLFKINVRIQAILFC